MENKDYMKQAYLEAVKAFNLNEVPVGAVVVCDGKIIGRGFNKREILKQCTAHAEVEAINEASRKLGRWHLEDCQLYVTLEPCVMCAGTIIQSRIEKVYYGASDNKAGFFGGLFDLNNVQLQNHYPLVISGIMEEECKMLMDAFFKKLRNKQPKENPDNV